MQFTDNEILFISELLIKILNADIKQRVKSDIQEILDKSFDTTEITVSVSKEESKTDSDTVSVDDSKTVSSDDSKTVSSDDTKTVSSDDSKNNDDPKITKKRGRPQKRISQK
jgi:hypothetical protein